MASKNFFSAFGNIFRFSTEQNALMNLLVLTITRFARIICTKQFFEVFSSYYLVFTEKMW